MTFSFNLAQLSTITLLSVATAVAAGLSVVVSSTTSNQAVEKVELSEATQIFAYRAAGRFGGFAFYRGSEHGGRLGSLAFYRGSEHGGRLGNLAFYRASERGIA